MCVYKKASVAIFSVFSAAYAGEVYAAPKKAEGAQVGNNLNLMISGLARFECTLGDNSEEYTFFFDKSSSANSVLSKGSDGLFAVNNSRITVEALQQMGSILFKGTISITGDGHAKQSVRENYLMVEHDQCGTVIFGDTRGVEQRMTQGPTNFLPGGGGIDSSVARKFVNAATMVYLAPSLVGDTGYSTKFSYYTPTLAGFQFGVSVTPNTHHMGEGEMETATSPLAKAFAPFDTWSVGLGLSYVLQVQDFALRLSAVHLTGTTHPELPKDALNRRDTNVWDFGAVVEFGALKLGAEYLYNGLSGTMVNPMMNIEPVINGVTLEPKDYDPDILNPYWALALGVGLVNDIGGIALSYFYTQRDTGICETYGGYCSQALGRSLVLSMEYNLIPGISPYIEGGIYNTENPDFAYVGAGFSSAAGLPYYASGDNDAKAVLMGLKFKF